MFPPLSNSFLREWVRGVLTILGRKRLKGWPFIIGSIQEERWEPESSWADSCLTSEKLKWSILIPCSYYRLCVFDYTCICSCKNFSKCKTFGTDYVTPKGQMIALLDSELGIAVASCALGICGWREPTVLAPRTANTMESQVLSSEHTTWRFPVQNEARLLYSLGKLQREQSRLSSSSKMTVRLFGHVGKDVRLAFRQVSSERLCFQCLAAEWFVLAMKCSLVFAGSMYFAIFGGTCLLPTGSTMVKSRPYTSDNRLMRLSSDLRQLSVPKTYISQSAATMCAPLFLICW